MTLLDLTRVAVLAAVHEFDTLGRDTFLDKYGFHQAVSYFLVHEGKYYDSKAIAGAAHGYLPLSAPLTSKQFSGGEGTVQPALERLGFRVISDGRSAGVEENTLQDLESEMGRREQMWRDLVAAEDIITDLSKISSLFVISRNSSFTYKGNAVDRRRSDDTAQLIVAGSRSV